MAFRSEEAGLRFNPPANLDCHSDSNRRGLPAIYPLDTLNLHEEVFSISGVVYRLKFGRISVG